MVFADARQRRPFTIDAIVILPDHLYCIWTLPPDDADFAGTISKPASRLAYLQANTFQHVGLKKASVVFGSAASGSIPFVTPVILNVILIIFTTIRSSTNTLPVCMIGLIPVFIVMSGVGFIR